MFFIYFLFFIYSCFIRFDIDGNEVEYDVELEVNNDNKYDLKLIDEVANVKIPKEGMLYSSLEELEICYKTYAKQQGFGVVIKTTKNDASGYKRYITLACAR